VKFPEEHDIGEIKSIFSGFAAIKDGLLPKTVTIFKALY